VFALLLLLIFAAIVELYVMVQVASVIGVLPTVLLIVVSSVVGAWLMKVEGLGVLRRMRETLEAGQIPANEAVDGVLISAGGLLMFLPGFVTSAIGLLLLLPPVRSLLRPVVLTRARRRIERARTRMVLFSSDGSFGAATYGGSVRDVDSHLWSQPDDPRPADGPPGSLPELGP
jgi:UPF0716 protein FxsA